jgi:hypothetical protein
MLLVQIILVLFIIFSLHEVFCGSEGILRQRDRKFLERMYAVSFIVVPYLMLQENKAAKTGANLGLIRIAAWVGRVAWLQWKTDREAILAATNDLPAPAN